MRSDGPFSDFPPTMGHTASTSRLRARSASRIPGTARIGPMLISGLLGQIRIRPASRIASRTPGAGSRQSEKRSEEHTSELQSRVDLVCRLLLEKKKQNDIWR